MKQYGLRLADSENRIDPTPPTARSGDTIDLERLLAGARRQIIPFALCAFLGLLMGVAYLATTPKTYRTGATVLLAGNVNRGVEEISSFSEMNGTDGALESAVQVIRSREMALTVTDSLDLQSNESFQNPPASLLGTIKTEIRSLIAMPLALLGDEPEVQVATPIEEAEAARASIARALQNGVIVQRQGLSTAITIGYESHDPSLARDIANAYASAYEADLLNANFAATESATEWLQLRLTELEASSQQAALDVEMFRVENGLTASDGALMTERNVGQLNTDLATATADTARARGLVDIYGSVLDQGLDAFVAEGGSGFPTEDDPRLAEMQDRLTGLTVRISQIEQQFGTDHPQVAVLRDEKRVLSEALFGELGRLHTAARIALGVAQAREVALQQSLGTAVDVNAVAGTAQVELNALEQRALTLGTLYQTFLTRFQEIDQQKTFPVSNIRILSQADLPRSAATPGTGRVLALMLILGGMIGFCIGCLREYRDRFFRTGADVQQISGNRFLGYLPAFAAKDQAFATVDIDGAETFGAARLIRRQSFVMQNARSHYTETLRNLRLALDLSLAGKQDRVLGLTSVRPGEGKSTIAWNFADMLASTGAKVLLIDADPRSPGLSRSLGVTQGAGLIEAVQGTVPWQDVLCVKPDTGLRFMPCIRSNGFLHSSDVINSPGMRRFLSEAAAAYTHVVIDMAPLGPVVDARVILPWLDRVAMIAEWGVTPKALLRSTLATEPMLTEKLLGVMLNKVDMKGLESYGSQTGPEAFFGEYGDYMKATT